MRAARLSRSVTGSPRAPRSGQTALSKTVTVAKSNISRVHKRVACRHLDTAADITAVENFLAGEVWQDEIVNRTTRAFKIRADMPSHCRLVGSPR